MGLFGSIGSAISLTSNRTDAKVEKNKDFDDIEHFFDDLDKEIRAEMKELNKGSDAGISSEEAFKQKLTPKQMVERMRKK